jgi:hypothetical protein
MTKHHRFAAVFTGLAVVAISFVGGAPAWASSKSAPRLSTKAQITADWKTFFAGTTSSARKIALLQNGKSFTQVIDGQAGSAMAKSVTAKVSKVTLVSPSKATVLYSLELGGEPALSNVSGEAILQDRVWKVGDQSFCALLALEEVKVPACPSGHG